MLGRAHQEVIEQKGRQTDVLRRKQREFRVGIIQQIHEKQEERIQERRAKYQEGVKLEEQAKMRRQRLEEAKIRKLNELRSVLRAHAIQGDVIKPSSSIMFIAEVQNIAQRSVAIRVTLWWQAIFTY